MARRRTDIRGSGGDPEPCLAVCAVRDPENSRRRRRAITALVPKQQSSAHLQSDHAIPSVSNAYIFVFAGFHVSSSESLSTTPLSLLSTFILFGPSFPPFSWLQFTDPFWILDPGGPLLASFASTLTFTFTLFIFCERTETFSEVETSD